MPYNWTETDEAATLTLWPHQSLTHNGFSGFIIATATMLALPLMAMLGTAILWILLAFFAAAIWGVWRAIMVNRRARLIEETLVLSQGELLLTHRPAKGLAQTWSANPQWVVVHLRNDGPVENYLTLTGGGREVELGAFLTAEERVDLADDLERRLHAAR